MIFSDSEPERQLRCTTTAGLDDIAAHMLELFQGERVFAISGPMGAGKTTFIQAVCRQLGVRDNVSSPTFSIVNEYSAAGGDPVYHFDLYRLRKPGELMDIGYEDYFYSGNYCFIEWPELAESLMPEEGVAVNIFVEEGTQDRIFRFAHAGRS